MLVELALAITTRGQQYRYEHQPLKTSYEVEQLYYLLYQQTPNQSSRVVDRVEFWQGYGICYSLSLSLSLCISVSLSLCVSLSTLSRQQLDPLLLVIGQQSFLQLQLREQLLILFATLYFLLPSQLATSQSRVATLPLLLELASQLVVERVELYQSLATTKGEQSSITVVEQVQSTLVEQPYYSQLYSRAKVEVDKVEQWQLISIVVMRSNQVELAMSNQFHGRDSTMYRKSR